MIDEKYFRFQVSWSFCSIKKHFALPAGEDSLVCTACWGRTWLSLVNHMFTVGKQKMS